MKQTVIIATSLLMFMQANANYGIRPPVTGAPDSGSVSVPRAPSGPNEVTIGIGRFEQIQISAQNVIRASAVKADRKKKYQEALIEIGLKDAEIGAWILEMDTYFKSDEYKNQSKAQKEKDQFEARMMIEMTVTQFGSSED